jgi:hypothetical protein
MVVTGEFQTLEAKMEPKEKEIFAHAYRSLFSCTYDAKIQYGLDNVKTVPLTYPIF